MSPNHDYDICPDEQRIAMATERTADALEDLNKLLRSYLKFSLGMAANAMRISDSLPPEFQKIMDDLEGYNP